MLSQLLIGKTLEGYLFFPTFSLVVLRYIYNQIELESITRNQISKLAAKICNLFKFYILDMFSVY